MPATQAEAGSMTAHLPPRHDLAPRDGASIAVFKDRKVLLVKRGTAPFAGLWSLPGGKIESRETPRQAACRELKEETGIEAEVEGIIDTVKVAPGGSRRHRDLSAHRVLRAPHRREPHGGQRRRGGRMGAFGRYRRPADDRGRG